MSFLLRCRCAVWRPARRECCCASRLCGATAVGVHVRAFVLSAQRLWRELRHIMKVAQTLDAVQCSLETLAEGALL